MSFNHPVNLDRGIARLNLLWRLVVWGSSVFIIGMLMFCAFFLFDGPWSTGVGKVTFYLSQAAALVAATAGFVRAYLKCPNCGMRFSFDEKKKQWASDRSQCPNCQLNLSSKQTSA